MYKKLYVYINRSILKGEVHDLPEVKNNYIAHVSTEEDKTTFYWFYAEWKKENELWDTKQLIRLIN